MPARYRGRSTLGQGLDREVYQVVRKIVDERAQYGNSTRVNIATVYEEIRRSNSSLNRKPKKLIEDSVERVLATIQQDLSSSSDTDALDGEGEDISNSATTTTTNSMNRSIVGAWGTPRPASAATTTVDSRPIQEQDVREKSAVESEPPQANKRRANGEVVSKKRKVAAAPTIDRSPPTHVTLADLGGVDAAIQQIEDLLVLPMTMPHIYSSSKIQPPRGVLIHGPPGCGKTMIANAFAAELGVNFISISAPSIVSGMSGESEKALRDHFEEAKRCAPCLMFIDEIDAITPKRDGAQREMEKRIVAQLLTCMDDIGLEKTDGKPVIVLAATNRPDSLDPALRRGGRFDKEINMSVPSEPVREQILRALTRDGSISSDVDLAMLARLTPGFVGADLNDLVSTAGAAAIKRYMNVLKSNSEMDIDMDDSESSKISPTVLSLRRTIKYTKGLSPDDVVPLDLDQNVDQSIDGDDIRTASLIITPADFLTALPQIQPSALREGFATIPTTTFASIGSLQTHISDLQTTVISPIVDPSLYSDLGITPSSGTLLWGPPGCGKTLLAKAVANSSHANFISVKGPELLNKYVGESERAVRQLFNRARSSVPVIIFFDELDALVPRRDGTMSEASARVVNTLLTELDGIGNGTRDGIYVIAATNRPDIIDPAMLRPGRLETLLFVGLPDAEGRIDILRTLCKKLKNFTWSDELASLAGGNKCEGFSGADLEALLRRAGYAAIRRGASSRITNNINHESFSGNSTTNGAIPGEEGASVNVAISMANGTSSTGRDVSITLSDFEHALTEVRRSVSIDEMKRFERLQREWGKTA